MIFAPKLPQTLLFAALLMGATIERAHADTYNIPQALTDSPYNCTLTAGIYNCGSITLPHHTEWNVTAPTNIRINGSFYSDHHFVTNNGGKKLNLDVSGSLYIAHQSTIEMDLNRVGGSAHIAHQTSIKGDIYTGGSFQLDHQSLVDGNVDIGGDMVVGNHSDITGTCIVGGHTSFTGCGAVTPPPATLDHFLIEHEGTGLTCKSSAVKVWACSAAATGGTCPTISTGASGTLQVINDFNSSLISSQTFTIPAGQTFTTINVSYAPANVKNIRFGTTTAGTTCWDGDAASCVHKYYDSAFEYDIPTHISGVTQQNITISAIKKGASNTCAPAWSGPWPVSFNCTYVDPNTPPLSGAKLLTVRSGNTAINLTCGGGALPLSINFDADGKGLIDVTYPDAGSIQLAATYASNFMYGSSTFTAYPKSFQVTWPTTPRPSTLVAGSTFDVTVVAMNGASTPAATPNYGRESTPESAQLSFTKCKPTNGKPGVYSGTLSAFSAGSATSTDSTWDEVGTGDITATNTEYMATGKAITGSTNTESGGCTGLFGRFRPHHFTTTVVSPPTYVTTLPAPAVNKAWAYSGQPFTVEVSALNAAGRATQNYFVEGTETYSRDVTLAAWSTLTPSTVNPGPGALATNTLLAAAFQINANGEANVKPAYTFTSPLTKPTALVIRATDTDGTTSSGHTEANIEIRSGRVRIFNAFGPRTRDLDVPLQVEYYTGNSWLLNTIDNNTVLPSNAFGLTTPQNMAGVIVTTGATINAGTGTIRLKAPTNAANDSNGSGRIDIAANLGNTNGDAACLPSPRPTTTGSAFTWLRSLYGSCNTNWTQDPSARATFGSTTPENRSTIYVREVFN